VKFRDELKASMKAEDIAEAKKIYDEKKKSMTAGAAPTAPATPEPAPATKKGTKKSSGN